MNIVWPILTIILGVIALIVIFSALHDSKSASDITYILGQRGSMRKGLWFYISLGFIGAALLTGGIIWLITII